MGRRMPTKLRARTLRTDSGIVGTDVSCRSWQNRGQEHAAPPPTLSIEALLREIHLGVLTLQDPIDTIFP